MQLRYQQLQLHHNRENEMDWSKDFKKHLNYISDKLLATFPEPQRSAHDCVVCRAAVGRWNGVVMAEVPAHLKGLVAQNMVEVMVCPACYELPNLFETVSARVEEEYSVRVLAK